MPPIKTPGTIASLFWAPETPDQPTMRASTTFERLHDLYAALRDYVPLLPENDIQPLATVLQSRGAAAEESAALPAVRQTLKAFHGSPHDFEQFSSAKIGTGEGAQAYGHGLYFGEHPDTGRSYRDIIPATERSPQAVLDTNMRISGKPVTDVYSAIEAKAARMPIKQAQPLYDRLSVLEDLMMQGDALGVRERGTHSPEAMDWFEKEVVPNFTRKGKLYEVKLHVSPDDLLDWDKPLAQQSPKVQEALAKLDPDTYHPTGADYDANETGQQTYHRLFESNILSGKAKPAKLKQAETSKQLAKLGIKGVRYLDQGSRDTGEGTRNIVMFPGTEHLIEIAKKYGISLPAAAALYKWQQSQKTQKGVE